MTEAPAVTLYSDGFWISPYVFSCFVALREKGVPFEVNEVRLDEAAQRRPEYRTGSWTGRVPSLVHGDLWLSESSAILEYLEEAFPAPAHPRIYPEGRVERARARQLLSWLRSDETLPVRAERSAEIIFYDLPRAPLTAKTAGAAVKALELAERYLAGGDGYLFGEWSVADSELAFFLHRLWHDAELMTPALRRYAEAQWMRPSVQAYVSHARPAFVPYG
jgi:glutathione S-transferase